jgi:exodeoxyribonuclease VII large subunit
MLERKRAALEATWGKLTALSPKATLSRGYAIVRTDEGIVRTARTLSTGDRVDVELAEGGFGARIEETRE